MSHDTSSPLACHDWGDHDDPLPPIADPDDPDTGHKLLSRMKSVESLRSRSSASSASAVRRSWKCPPSRLNSRISTRTEDLIQEEDEEEYDDEATGILLFPHVSNVQDDDYANSGLQIVHIIKFLYNKCIVFHINFDLGKTWSYIVENKFMENQFKMTMVS